MHCFIISCLCVRLPAEDELLEDRDWLFSLVIPEHGPCSVRFPPYTLPVSISPFLSLLFYCLLDLSPPLHVSTPRFSPPVSLWHRPFLASNLHVCLHHGCPLTDAPNACLSHSSLFIRPYPSTVLHALVWALLSPSLSLTFVVSLFLFLSPALFSRHICLFLCPRPSHLSVCFCAHLPIFVDVSLPVSLLCLTLFSFVPHFSLASIQHR